LVIAHLISLIDWRFGLMATTLVTAASSPLNTEMGDRSRVQRLGM